eukprot:c20117_g1_i1 orf=889-2313(+)
MGNSLGCSPSGERLVSAARDGDLQEAQALLEFNTGLAKYSTFGARNTPLHFAAAQGHNEIVMLLLHAGIDIDIRNYCGQTALMQACRYGHWEVVQTLILNKANVKRADYLNGRTALHFAAINGHARCIRLLFADYIPSVVDWNKKSTSALKEEGSSMPTYLDRNSLSRIVNWPADGGITALHMAALNGHFDCVQLLLDLTADVSALTVHDGTTIHLTGAGSTPLHYAACGGSAICCQLLISRGASRTDQNSNGWTALQVACLWRRHWLEALLAPDSRVHIPTFVLSRHLALPLMSIVNIAREYSWRNVNSCPGGIDLCAVCLERKCTVAAEGCRHELCIRCALYLCSTNSASTVSGLPGSIPCPLCRAGIVSFVKLRTSCVTKEPSMKELPKASISFALCTACSTEVSEPMILASSISSLEYPGSKASAISLHTSRAVSCQRFPLRFMNCQGDIDKSNSSCDSGRPERKLYYAS